MKQSEGAPRMAVIYGRGANSPVEQHKRGCYSTGGKPVYGRLRLQGETPL